MTDTCIATIASDDNGAERVKISIVINGDGEYEVLANGEDAHLGAFLWHSQAMYAIHDAWGAGIWDLQWRLDEFPEH